MIESLMEPKVTRVELSQQERIATLRSFNRMCYAHLLTDVPMRNYLDKRKISWETITQFGIGSMPNPEKVRNHLGSNAFKTSLLSTDENGNLISKFTNNPLIIPIFDQYNQEIAVIGRAVCSDEDLDKLDISKYNNTSFRKGEVLFGLNLALDSIREKNKVFVVEGNFDVISAHQSGFKNVVATSGTMFTHHQLVTLTRYTDNIVLLFDNDEKGQEAADSHVTRYKEYGVNIRKGNVPENFKDLDEYLRSKDSK